MGIVTRHCNPRASDGLLSPAFIKAKNASRSVSTDRDEAEAVLQSRWRISVVCYCDTLQGATLQGPVMGCLLWTFGVGPCLLSQVVAGFTSEWNNVFLKRWKGYPGHNVCSPMQHLDKYSCTSIGVFFKKQQLYYVGYESFLKQVNRAMFFPILF